MSSASFNVRTERFEGPLDLLLSLIEARKLYINEIALAEVTDAYLHYLENAVEHPIAETAQFVYIAATLLLIKSRSLLPDMELTREEEHDIKELERRLEQYRIMHSAALKLGKLWGDARLLPSRYRPKAEAAFTPGAITLISLGNAIRHVLDELPTAAFRATVHVASTLSLEEVVSKLRTRIMNASRILFSEIKKGGTKADVIIHFLALLELVKGGIVAAEQSGSFDDIVVATEEIETPRY
jgi:segregation and condensation protein A